MINRYDPTDPLERLMCLREGMRGAWGEIDTVKTIDDAINEIRRLRQRVRDLQRPSLGSYRDQMKDAGRGGQLK